MSHRRARALTVVLLALPLVLLSGPAHAHEQLISSDPADGQSLPAAPTHIVLTYSADLIDLSQDVQVTVPDGRQLTGLPVDVVGAVVTATLPDGLGDGAYRVVWRVVSGDGHPIEGTFGFDVGDGAAAPAPTQTTAPAVSPGAGVPTAVATTAQPDAASSGPAPAWPWVAGVVALVVATVAAVLRTRRRR